MSHFKWQSPKIFWRGAQASCPSPVPRTAPPQSPLPAVERGRGAYGASIEPPRLVDDGQLVSHAGRRRLRSADIDTCCVPRTNTRLGDRNFAAAGPRSGTVCQPGFASPTTTSENFVGSWNRFCLIDTAAHSDYAPVKYSYSLTHRQVDSIIPLAASRWVTIVFISGSIVHYKTQ